MKVGWYLTETMKPAGVVGDTEWILTIEGRPSVRCVLDVRLSFETDDALVPGEPAAPAWPDRAMIRGC